MADLKGKVVVLNFWQTWCPPCRQEMPDFDKVYRDSGQNGGDVVILGVSTPRNAQNTLYTREQEDAAGLAQFMSSNGYSYPTLMDYTGALNAQYGIQAFPTTFIIAPNGNIYGMVPGMLSYTDLLRFIEAARQLKS